VQYTVVSVTRLNELKFDIPVPSLKFLHNLWAKPAKVLLMECQWEIIVVEVCIWGDSLLNHVIYEPVVVIHSFLVHLTSSIWKILDQEIENRYASNPMFFIMFTSSLYR